MGRIRIKRSANKYIVENKLTKNEIINEREYKNIFTGVIKNLSPVKKEKSFSGKVLKYSIVDSMPIKTYINGIINKQNFLNVVFNIINVIKQCEKNLMNINNLVIDTDYIFINPSTTKITCIYYPVVNPHTTKDLAPFFSELPYKFAFNKEENLDYVSDYLEYFSAKQFSLNSFEELIIELSDQPLVKEDNMSSLTPVESTKYSQSKSGIKLTKSAKENNFVHHLNHQTNSSNVTQEDSKICSNCEKVHNDNKQYCGQCGYPLTRIQPSILVNIQNHISPNSNSELTTKGYIDSRRTPALNETTVLGGNEIGTTVLGEDDVGGTTVLGVNYYEEPTFPYLIREKSQEEISVNKPSFRIGKEKSYCDYFVSDNNAISRSHADIITKGNRYFIVDNNSTNKTYLDNQAIPVNQEVEIFSGTKLKLGNEEFVFYI
ncbi:FHA domain-containing protein [Rossellomorea aquimaris]|uniref:FHA domain-containing protein n=1 Tax=Rossellomorea aquimaris TaxID=189382 RepID=UPI001CD425FE|nr:FHA domain-containing protein [Rossellomorea aquimaris]MCA1054934.1 FHA domain-containing protein [Rossellomorea aquimaris]